MAGIIVKCLSFRLIGTNKERESDTYVKIFIQKALDKTEKSVKLKKREKIGNEFS